MRSISSFAVCLAAAAMVSSSVLAQDVIVRHEPSRETSKQLAFVPAPSTPVEGQQVDVAPFGEFRTWSEGKDIGVLWEDMRDIFRVVVEFPAGAAAPDPSSVKLQYWQSQWPYRQIPRTESSGSGWSGWLNMGDWFKGIWKDVDADLKVDGNTWTYTFHPTNEKEFPELPDFKGTWRSTFKMRLLFPDKVPVLSGFHTHTDSTWKKMDAAVEWAPGSPAWTGAVRAFNGIVDTASRGVDGSMAVSFWHTEPVAVNSFDPTVITLRGTPKTLSFAAKDLAQGKRIFIRDYGVLVRRADDPVTYAEMEAAYAKAPKDVYRRIHDMPEQTLTRAWNDMPEKNRIYMNLDCEGGRQYFRLLPNGDITLSKKWLDRIPGPDTNKADWGGSRLTFDFDLPEPTGSGASIEDGYLPIAVTWWEHNWMGMEQARKRIKQTAFVTTLSGRLPHAGRVKADEPLVCMVEFSFTNTTEAYNSGIVPVRLQAEGRKEPDNLLKGEDGLVYAVKGDSKRIRFRVQMDSKTTIDDIGYSTTGNTPCFTVVSKQIPPYGTCRICLAIPFITPKTPAEIAQLKALDFDKQHKMIADYWRKRTAQATQITTPEPMLNDFYKANPSHQLINTQNEIGTDERYIANVGTGSYGVFPNESIMMITDLDRRGYHNVAEKALETFIKYQGTVGLPGDFSTKDGVYFGARGYEEGGYNQHQGWVLWGMAEHYWFTRDAAWLDRVAPSLIRGCDWIVNERKRMNGSECVGIRSIEQGLMPQGKLEDIGDWRCWLSTNAFSYWGLNNAAKALADRGNPEGRRLLREAADYKKDILNAYTEAMLRSPVVGLRDGTYVPYLPSDVHRRGRSFGWITETLEGAIHLIRCGVIDPDSDIARWTMQDYEDNRYISQQYGYQTPYFERDWFSIGGFSQQPSLLCSPTPYLLSDQPKHYLRAYFNAFSAGYFPERAMLTEHPLPNLGNWAGGHFKTSDEAMNCSWLRWMFIWDEGDDLYLGRTMPRYWLADGKEVKIERAATHFGPMSMRIKSFAKSDRIEMTIDPPTRNHPKAVYARFRHPDGKSMNRVTMNGKPYEEFDPVKEWVVLPALREKTVVVAYYD